MSDTTNNTFAATRTALPATLVYNGEVIHDRAEKLSLTDMWRAAGAPESNRPTDWLALTSTAEFRSAVEATFNAGKSGIETIRGGRRSGTWAHWQIALAYAKYLSPEFHMWCNTVVRDRMEGRPVPQHVAVSDLDQNVRALIGNMVKNCTSVVIREAMHEILPAMVAAELSRGNVLRRHGRTSGQIWQRYGLPKMKNAPTWLGNRLAEMGCAVNGNERADIGTREVRLFDPDKADLCMKNGLLHATEAYIGRRRGQGTLRLVPGRGLA